MESIIQYRNIGCADRLGSGVRNLFKYSKYYSGQEPEFIEGNVFRTFVPLDENHSYDAGKKTAIKSGDKKVTKRTQMQYEKILGFMVRDKEYGIQDFCELLNLKESRTKEILTGLSEYIEPLGSKRSRRYRLK